MKKKISIIVIVLLILGLFVGGYFWFFKKDLNNDALKFKNEYESLNNTIRESDGNLYNNVNIPENNPIKYVNIEETLDLLTSKKAIIYIGANWCPWCRNMLEPMFDVAKKLNIDSIYYLNLDDEKSNYEIVDGNVKKVSTGTDAYYKLLDKLSAYLRDYELTDADGNVYKTGEKRVYIPFFITVRNGSVVEAKGISRTLEDGQNKYSEMTIKQYEDLYDKFLETFAKVYDKDGSCSVEEECI